MAPTHASAFGVAACGALGSRRGVELRCVRRTPIVRPARSLRACAPSAPSAGTKRESGDEQTGRAVEASKLEVCDGVQGGRGVVARTRIEGGEVMARVPEAAALVVCFADALSDSASDDYPFAKGQWVSATYWRVADWDAKLATLLLYHQSLGALSAWYDYVQSLPLPWTAADLAPGDALDLQYTPMLDAVEVYRFRLADEYQRMRASLPAQMRETVSEEDFGWAWKVVHSRAFSIPPGGFAASATRMGLRGSMQRDTIGVAEWPRKFALVPLLDMMNHGTGRKLAKFRFDAVHETFELVAGADGYEPHSQVLVSYGDLTNDDLLLLYGFVQAGNPSDVFEVEDIQEWATDHKANSEWNLYARKIGVLEETGLLYEGRKYFISRENVDEHLIATLRVLLADAQQLTEMAAQMTSEQLKRKEAPKAWYAPYSEENELAVWTTVERQCDRMLAEFPTSLDQDEEMIILLAAGSSQTDVSVSAPLLFRVEKKRILRDAVQLAAMKKLFIATNTSKESELSVLRHLSDAKPPPPETWDEAP